MRWRAPCNASRASRRPRLDSSRAREIAFLASAGTLSSRPSSTERCFCVPRSTASRARSGPLVPLSLRAPASLAAATNSSTARACSSASTSPGRARSGAVAITPCDRARSARFLSARIPAALPTAALSGRGRAPSSLTAGRGLAAGGPAQACADAATKKHAAATREIYRLMWSFQTGVCARLFRRPCSAQSLSGVTETGYLRLHREIYDLNVARQVAREVAAGKIAVSGQETGRCAVCARHEVPPVACASGPNSPRLSIRSA